MVFRQTSRADAVSQPELSEYFHAARTLRAALRMPARRRLGIEQHARHAKPVEERRECETDWSAADNADRCMSLFGLCVPHDDTPAIISDSIVAKVNLVGAR